LIKNFFICFFVSIGFLTSNKLSITESTGKVKTIIDLIG